VTIRPCRCHAAILEAACCPKERCAIVPSSILLVVGIAALLCGVVLSAAAVRLRRRLDETSRLLLRVTTAADEVERIEWAWRRLGDGFTLARDGATSVNDVVRRSGQALAGIPYAILESLMQAKRRDDPS
jgi:hypothetical protein